MNQYVFRYAEESDAALVLYFIKELAKYEKMLDEVVATEEILKEWIFEKKRAKVNSRLTVSDALIYMKNFTRKL